MAYEVVMPYHLHMRSYFLETFTEYPFLLLHGRNVSIRMHKQIFFGNQSVPTGKMQTDLSSIQVNMNIQVPPYGG